MQTFETNSNNTASQEQDSCRNILRCAGLGRSFLCDQIDFVEQQEISSTCKKDGKKEKRTWSLSW